MCKLITITGATAVGKDTIFDKILKYADYKPIISDTTRPMRVGEVQDKTYHFISNQEFVNRKVNNQYIENREYKTEFGYWYYGINKNEIDIESNNTYLVIVDYQGVNSLREYCNKNGIKIKSFYITSNVKTRILRSLNRDKIDNEKSYEICRRILKDRDEIEAFCEKDNELIKLKNEKDEDIINCVFEIIKECEE